MAKLRRLGDAPNMIDLRTAFPEVMAPLHPFTNALMRGPSPFTPGERELIAAYVSGLNGCRYCHGVHSEVAAAFGIDPTVLAALLDDVETADVDARLRPVLRYARALTERPSRMETAEADAVYEAGWDDTALFHAVAVCAYFNMMNRLAEGVGLVGSPDLYRAAAAQLSSDGAYETTAAPERLGGQSQP